MKATETPGSPVGSGSWIAEAIAEQEEHIKRYQSCQDRPFTPHRWESFAGDPGGPKYSACWVCRVTKTPEDLSIKTGKV